MFTRKIEPFIEDFLQHQTNRILLIDGARQIGKSYIIRHVGQTHFANYVEINLMEDYTGARIFSDVHSLEHFYMQLSIIAGEKLGSFEDTLVFLDEIQVYPHLMTLLKFLNMDRRYHYIASGSMLGIALRKTVSLPMGSIETKRMYPMDFEEFLLAVGVGRSAIERMHDDFRHEHSLPESTHRRMLELFKYYLITGGLPDAIREFTEKQNIPGIRKVQAETHQFYAEDASQYSSENKLHIREIYDSIPSLMENRKKRVVVNKIENKKGKTFDSYKEDFDYLTASGIALGVKAVSTPVFPLVQCSDKNLLKLYLNDPGILSSVLYGNNIQAILNDHLSVNLGSLYESAAASELAAHGYELYYYDNRKKGEVDFLIDSFDSLSVIPIEIKSGKDYTTHASLDRFLSNEDYHIQQAYVFSNSGEVTREGKILYCPIYMIMFLQPEEKSEDILPLPDLGELKA